jgi:hypothetical protein
VTDDLVAFVLARADEREAAALSWAATTVSWAGFTDAAVDEFVHNGEPHTYLALADPARVLREVAAVRAIVAEHPIDYFGSCCQCCGQDDNTGGLVGPWPCETLRLLASLDSDHVEFRAEWA